MQTFTLLSTVSFILIFNNFLSAQGNCLPSSHCSTATELVISADIEGNLDCDVEPSPKEGKTITLSSCNSNIEKNNDYFESHCITPNLQVVWYKFNSGNYEYADIKVNKSGNNPIQAFGVDLFSSCNDRSTLLTCGYAGLIDSFVSLNEIYLSKNTDYYFAIGSRLKDTGSFDLKIEIFNIDHIQYCGDGPAIITPDKLPPYNSGDVINFDVFIPPFSQTSTIQWAQGFVPVFGSGWDLSSFEYVGGPPSTSQLPNNNWQWWEEGNILVNFDMYNFKTYIDKHGRQTLCFGENCPEDNEGCLLAEQYLPAGWYAYQDGSGPNCEPGSGHPNLGWGDGQGPWELKFSLTVGNPEELEIDGEIDLGVTIHVLSDQQTGCWPNLDEECRQIVPKEFKAFNINCNNPPISAGEDLEIDCGVPDFAIIGSGPIDSRFIQYWGTIDGEIVGANDSYEIIGNSGGNYRLYLEDTIRGCVTYDEMRVDFNEIAFEMEVDDVICFGEMSGTASVITNGNVQWSTGETGNSISDLAPGNYRFTITEGNCEKVQTFQINQPVKGIDIAYETETDETTSEINLDISGGWGEYNIEWFFAGNSIANNVTELTVDQEGDYTVIVTDEKGCVETITINIDFTSSIITLGNNGTIRAYPNPVKNILFLEGDLTREIISYEIISVSGQTIIQSKNGIETGQLNVAHLIPAQYILKIITLDGRQGVMKFIKE